MSTLVIVGAQWGDEGKGKVVDLLAERAHSVARYGGGANAGHTLVVGGEKVVFHLVPSGALHRGPKCLLGAGMVIDASVLAEELETLRARDLLGDGRVLISERAQLVLPQHKLVDGLREEQSANPIGTTRRGIGPCYQDRAARRGLRIGDLRDEARFNRKVADNLEGWAPTIRAFGAEVPDAAATAASVLEAGRALIPFIGDVAGALHRARAAGERILLEGAQGTMLDIDHGTYPYVTSSSVTAGGAATGTGLGPTHIDSVLGITKAYTTRVGEGPFPTELHDAAGEALRAAGHEYGATTGRPRRCGWLDAVILNRAVQLNGIAQLALTKLDVLRGVDPLRIAIAYELDGERLETLPAEGLERAVPIYEEHPGFDEDLSDVRALEDLPDNARRYVRRIEELTGVGITIVSVGPGREETIVARDPWR